MASLIALIGQFAPYIYAVCGLVALFQMYRAWQVRQERRQAVFSYEREKAVRELYSIFFTALILLVVMSAAYFTSTTLKSVVDSSFPLSGAASADIIFVTTPTSTPLPATPTGTPAATATDTIFELSGIDTPVAIDPALPTATSATSVDSAAATATPRPIAPTATSAPIVSASACLDPRSSLASPVNGQTISGLVSIIGTASHEQFASYKIEYAPGVDVDAGYTYLGGGKDQVLNGVLWSFDARTLPAGVWTLRLTVVDRTGNWIEPRCKVTVNVN